MVVESVSRETASGMSGVHKSERAEGRGSPELGSRSVSSSLLPVSITSALALTTLISWLCYLLAGLPVICSVPRVLGDFSILKPDHVGPWLTFCHGSQTNALPARAPHELAVSDLISYPCFLASALKPSIFRPIPGLLAPAFSAPPSPMLLILWAQLKCYRL